MLNGLINENLIRLGIEASDWQEAVRKSAQPLLEEGKITAQYIDAIIENVKEAGPYIVITPHVALPHARPESGALQSAIGIATLVTPVEFGNAENDPVKYLFCLSATDNNSHLAALADLAALLEEQSFFDFLDQAKTAREVMDYLNK